MTSAHASLLMNKFFDDEATDAELKDLFLHIGENDRDRATFAAMKRVIDTLAAPQVVEFPHAIDDALSSLAMGTDVRVLRKRTATERQSSMLLSGFVAFLLTMTILVVAAKTVAPVMTVDSDSSMSFVYARSAAPSQSPNK